MMKIPRKAVFLIDSLGAGGAQRQFVQLVKGLDRDRIEPIVVTYHDLAFYKDELDRVGIRHYLIQKKDKPGLSFMIQFLKLLRETHPVFIHSFLNVPNFYARVAKLMGAVKTVITSERNVSITASPIQSILEKLFWRLSDLVVANAQAVKAVLVNKIGISDSRVRVIYNGVDVDHFKKKDPQKIVSMREKLGLPPEEGTLLGLIGRLAEQKNHLVLIQAMKTIKNTYPDLQIKVGFWGSETDKGYAKKIREQIFSFGLQDDFFINGPERDIASVYSACDVVVLPSLWEGFPNVVLEAMAAGRPVVASDIVDNAQIIDDGVNGFLVPVGDADALAEKIIKVIKMPHYELKGIVLRAENKIQKNYSADSMVKKTMQLYGELKIW